MNLPTRPGVERLSLSVGVAVAAVVVGAAIRLYRLGEEDLWVDEGHTLADATLRPLAEVLQIPTLKLHMPFYYLVVRAWTAVFGTSEVSLRFPSVVFGVAGIVALVYVGTRLYDRRVGALAAAFLSLSTLHLYHSQEARMYALATLLSLFSFYFLLQISERQRRRDWGGYVLCSVLLVLTSPTGLLVVLAQNVFVFSTLVLGRDHRLAISFRPWLGSQVVVGLLVSPWLLMFLGTLTGLSDSGSLPGSQTAGLTDVAAIPLVFLVGGVNEFVTYPVAMLLLGVVALVVLLGLSWYAVVGVTSETSLPTLRREPDDTHRTALVATWAAVPIVLPALLVPFGVGLFEYRYMIIALPALLLLVANGALKLRYRHLGVVIAGGIVLLQVLSVPVYYDSVQKQQWEETVAYIDANASPGELVLVATGGSTSGGAVTAFRYYFDRDDLDVAPVHYSIGGEELARLIEGREGVWLVVSGSEQTAQRFVQPLECSHEPTESTVYRSDGTWQLEIYHYETLPDGPDRDCTAAYRASD